jgi:hypothetical protein
MLMDEQPDVGLRDISAGDLSTVSFGSPVKTDSVESSFVLEVEADTTGLDDSLLGVEDEEDEGEKTIVLPKPPPAASPPTEPVTSPPHIAEAEVSTPARQPKVRINSEMERIAVSDTTFADR